MLLLMAKRGCIEKPASRPPEVPVTPFSAVSGHFTRLYRSESEERAGKQLSARQIGPVGCLCGRSSKERRRRRTTRLATSVSKGRMEALER
jgi:hypothetical protein